MVWGGMSQHHRTELVAIAGNLKLCVTGKTSFFLQAHPDVTLQHDNATSQTARFVHDFLQDRYVSVLPWPAKSPDLKPIEHIWDIPPRNVWELAGALVEEWGNISQQELTNLVQSMRRRCTAILNAAGGHTRY